MYFKKTAALLLSCGMISAMCACGKAKAPASFSDIKDGDWCATYVREAAADGFTLGYADGTYRPDKYITAGEFVTMLAKAHGADPKKFEARHWSFVYWEYLDQYGVFDNSHVTDLRTCLDAAITRQEAALLAYNAMVNMLGEAKIPTNDPAARIPGYISLDGQYLLPVAELYAKGILSGYENLEFYGGCFLTRGEAAALIVSLYDKTKRETAKPSPAAVFSPEGAFSSSTLFIGDSLTYEFLKNCLIPGQSVGSASYMAAPCTTVKYFLSSYWVLTPSEDNRYGVACSKGFENLSFGDAMAAGSGRYDTVYFMLGSYGSDIVTQNQYLDAIRLILKYNPRATVYIQTIPDGGTGGVSAGRVNGIIKEAVKSINAEGMNNVKLLDTGGILPKDSVKDGGLRLTAAGLDSWYRYIRAGIK